MKITAADIPPKEMKRLLLAAARGEEPFSIPELSVVSLRRIVVSGEGVMLPEGRCGTVVHAWSDDVHYLVEFCNEDATSEVVDVKRQDLRVEETA